MKAVPIIAMLVNQFDDHAIEFPLLTRSALWCIQAAVSEFHEGFFITVSEI